MSRVAAIHAAWPASDSARSALKSGVRRCDG